MRRNNEQRIRTITRITKSYNGRFPKNLSQLRHSIKLKKNFSSLSKGILCRKMDRKTVIPLCETTVTVRQDVCMTYRTATSLNVSFVTARRHRLKTLRMLSTEDIPISMWKSGSVISDYSWSCLMLLRTIATLLVMAGVFRLRDTAKLVCNGRVTLFSDTDIRSIDTDDHTAETTQRNVETRLKCSHINISLFCIQIR